MKLVSGTEMKVEGVCPMTPDYVRDSQPLTSPGPCIFTWPFQGGAGLVCPAGRCLMGWWGVLHASCDPLHQSLPLGALCTHLQMCGFRDRLS